MKPRPTNSHVEESADHSRLLSVIFYCLTAVILLFFSTVIPSVQAMAACEAGDANGLVFRDDDANGSAVGDLPLAGVVIGVFDTAGTLLGQGTTDGSGRWSISNMPLDTPVRLQMVAKPGALTGAPLGVDNPGFVSFSNTESCIEQNFGLLLASACSDLPIEVGNRVWFDRNSNGQQDPEEMGVGGVTVSLYDATDTLIAQKVTDSTGLYLFTDEDGLLADTDYTIRLDNPTDYDAGGPLFESVLSDAFQGSDPQLDSDAQLNATTPEITFTSGPQGSAIHRYDIGFKPSATIGNRVWLDLNGNGVQDRYDESYASVFQELHDEWEKLIDLMALVPETESGLKEPGMAGVTVQLYGAGNDAVVGTADDELLREVVTDENGDYLFRPVDPGVPYRVAVVESSLPAGIHATYDEDGAGDHAIVIAALAAGEQHWTADFGYRGHVDLGIEKTASIESWDDSDSVSWTVNVTNHGSQAAPKVIVADVLGQYLEEVTGWPRGTRTGADVIFSRAGTLAMVVNENGIIQFGEVTVSSEEELDALVADWISNHVSVTGEGWSCQVEHKANYPRGWEYVWNDSSARMTESYYRYAPTVDINLYWLCELTSGDLVPGATASPITFTVSNELNGWTHDLEYGWVEEEPDNPNLNNRIDLVGSVASAEFDNDPPADQLNTVITSSAYGDEFQDDHPNKDSVIISADDDLTITKEIVSGSPIDVGTPVVFRVTVTNTGTKPYYRTIFLEDTLFSNAVLIDTATFEGGLWQCMRDHFAAQVYQHYCIHPMVPGGLAPGDSLTLEYEANYLKDSYTQETAISAATNRAILYHHSSLDNDSGNNQVDVPAGFNTSSISTAKGAAIQENGLLKWVMSVNLGGSTLPEEQVIIIDEQLQSALVSVEDNGWQCESYPVDPDWDVAGIEERRYWQRCWYDPPGVHGDVTAIPDLVIYSEYMEGAANTACPGRGIRLGEGEWNFGPNDQQCATSPVYYGVPGVPTDLTLTKVAEDAPWTRGDTERYTLTISELGVGPDRPVVWDQPAPGQTLVNVYNAAGQALMTAAGEPIAGMDWECSANFADDPLTTSDEGELTKCIRSTDLSDASDTLTVAVLVDYFADISLHNDAWVKGLTRAEPRKTDENLNGCEMEAAGVYPTGFCDNDDAVDVLVGTPDLQITKSHTDPVSAGEPFDFEIVIRNNEDFSGITRGDVPVPGPLLLPVTVTDAFPDGLNYTGFSGTGWSCSSDDATGRLLVTCQYGNSGEVLASGEAAPPLLLHSIAPDASLASAYNSAGITTDLTTIVVNNATWDATGDRVQLLAPQVVANKTASAPQVLVGDPVTGTIDFTLSIENTQGTGLARAPVRIVDTVPAEFAVNSINDNGLWDCSSSTGQVVDCVYTAGGTGPADFPAGTEATSVVVNVTAEDSARVGKVTNTMQVSHGSLQGLESTLTAFTEVQVIRHAELSVSKLRDIAEPAPGDIIGYSITVQNTGVSPAEAVEVVDVLPYGTRYVDINGSDPAWSCSSDQGTPEKVTCQLENDLAGGGTTAPGLMLRLEVSAEALPGISNFISVSSNTATTPGSTVAPYHIDDYVVETGCIGDYVWWDNNRDGVEEGVDSGLDGEMDTLDDLLGLNGPGPDGTAGTADDCSHAFRDTTLMLDWAGADGVFDTADDVSDALTTTTDSKGYYNFDFLLPGEYRVRVDNSTGTLVCNGMPLSKYAPTYDLDSLLVAPDNTAIVTLGGTESMIRKDVDFGYDKQVDLELNKAVSPATVRRGEQATYTLTLSNKGPSDATGIEIVDKLPSGLRYISHTASQGSYDSASGLWSAIDLNVGSNATLNIVVEPR